MAIVAHQQLLPDAESGEDVVEHGVAVYAPGDGGEAVDGGAELKGEDIGCDVPIQRLRKLFEVLSRFG
jgi:hypothetical protein